ncbi:CoB--CoM heterodisulfide reductase iron-sulfur subunit B family protein [Sulfuricurvum sp.]|uniref:CoB--CoM heterodisulfide reductase iron-sulfur subunit B family protein n=1 Tax=Sulfuricurvum sp. TaxID=2025608 RepID=UPI0025D1E241|nr:CoB--CoM heterodisulfide reductase iron-sulfur subunit B family protein [Sulfuricurvum sp.]
MEKLKYALYTGCTARESTPELLKSTLAIADKLGIELILLDEASCCGASHLQDYDDFLSLVLNARNICYAEKLGLTMVTICNTCQLNTAMTKHRLDTNPELKAKVNAKLAEVGLEYKGSSEITHFLYALIQDYGLEKLAAKVQVPLSQFNIAPFYGCHNIRPSELQNLSNGGENPYTPTSLDDLIIACGGVNVNYEEKNKCCGFHAELQSPRTAAILTGNAIAGAMDANADWMVTPCPLCHLKLDVQNHSASKALGRDVHLPVLHMPQMVGLALGCTPTELGLNHHVTKVDFV